MEFMQDSYRYLLLPSALPPRHLLQRHDDVFRFWRETWTGVLQELGLDPRQLPDEFLRQDLIGALVNEEAVIAVHLYSFFALRSEAAREHSYLRLNYPPQFVGELQKRGIETVMSLEYMTVNPAWRKGKTRIPMGPVLASLGFRVMNHYGIDAAIAPARRDHRVHEMAWAFGGESVVESVMNHNVLCDLVCIAGERLRPFPDGQVEWLAANLWEKRVHVEPTGATTLGFGLKVAA